MNIRMNILAFLSITALAVSCGQNSSIKKPGSENPTDPDDFGGYSTCKASSILEVLANAQTVYVRENYGIQALRNIDSKVAIKRFNYANKYLKISKNGRYLIEKLSSNAFTVKRNIGKQKTFTIKVNTKSKRADIVFSPSEKYLALRYKSLSSKYIHRIEVYELETGSKVYANTFSSVNHIAFQEQTDHLVLGVSDGAKRKIWIWDWRKENLHSSIDLPRSDQFPKMFLSKDNVVVELSRNNYMAFSLLTGERTLDEHYKYLYAVSAHSNVAFFAKSWNEVEMVNLSTGAIIYTQMLSKMVSASTCQIRKDDKTVICKKRSESGMLVKWNLQEDSKKAFCL